MEEGGIGRQAMWRGRMASVDFPVRAAVAALLAASLLWLSFTQLGFVGIGNGEGDADIYLFVLLVPLSVGAFLLGVRGGALLGLVAGAVAYVHALQFPIDQYEMMVTTPLSSLGLYTVVGLLMGAFSAMASRPGLQAGRRVLDIAFLCAAGSVAFSALLMLCSYVWYALSGDRESFELISNLMGDAMGVACQMAIDAALMLAFCLLADMAFRRVEAAPQTRSIRSIFRGWLLLVVAIVFMLAGGVSFTVSSVQCLDAAHSVMRGEVEYLSLQILEAGGQVPENLLLGYDEKDDGLVVVMDAESVIASDSSDGGLAANSSAAAFVGVDAAAQAREVLDELAGTGKLTRTYLVSDGDKPEDVSSTIIYCLVGKVNDLYVYISRPSSMIFAQRGNLIMWICIVTLLMLVAVFALASRLLDRVVVRRIDETNEVLGQITEGDLDKRVDVRDSREFASLSRGINTTVDALKDSMDEITSKVETELATAKAIQESALPRTFPPFPDIDAFDVYASMHAARHVGGDFYDFFLVGTHRLAVVIADVSGKGVPAALFMMTAKTQLKNYLAAGVELAESINAANSHLCEGNDAGMFVTAFAGVLDYRSGSFEFVNAGHNPALLRQGGAWRWVTERSGMPLGVFDGTPYKKFNLQLGEGDALLLYTDGVTEAMDPHGHLFTEERLKDLVRDAKDVSPKALVEKVGEAVMTFENGAEQSDDITMLAMEYGRRPNASAQMVVEAKRENLPQVLDFIHEELEKRLCPPAKQLQLDIAVEELFVNIANYAYAESGGTGDAWVSYTYGPEPNTISVQLEDTGVPYDPLAKPDAVTPDNIADIPIGGLGILMAKKSVDELAYRREDGKNIVTMRKSW